MTVLSMHADGFRLASVLLLMGLGLIPAALHGQPLPDTLTFDRARKLLRTHNPRLRAAEAQAWETAAEVYRTARRPYLDAAQTGRRGDGKVFVTPVTEAIDIRTQQSGDEDV